MRSAFRLILVRSASLAGLLASAMLTADALHPDRKFCPLEAACAAARASALGSVFGVPTATLGLAAFAALFALSLIPSPLAKRCLFPACMLAAVCGAVLLAYQAIALEAFCPLCLVADLAGLAAGAAALGWKSRGLDGEVQSIPPAAPQPPGHRIAPWAAWSLVGACVVLAPILWPRGAGRPSWVAIAAASDREPASASISIVEYLNPFCAHCRATHARLAQALLSLSVRVERERLYVWTTKEVPLWAKACVCADDQGKERPFFAELLRAKDEGEGEIRAAASRAGLDLQALFGCTTRDEHAERLRRVHERVLAAYLEGLPTLDIGRRRLQGEQSEEELREALTAAAADLEGRPAPLPSR